MLWQLPSTLSVLASGSRDPDSSGSGEHSQKVEVLMYLKRYIFFSNNGLRVGIFWSILFF